MLCVCVLDTLSFFFHGTPCCPHAATAYDRFLMDYFPRPLEGGPPCSRMPRRPPRAPVRSVPLVAPQRSRPPGACSGTQGALCLEHGAPSCARCRRLGWGISRCCRAGHEGHTGSSTEPGCPRAPPRVAPGRQVLFPEARRAGAAALSSWPGHARPASQALPGSGPPTTHRCTAPPRLLGTRPTLGPDDPKPAKRLAPNRANFQSKKFSNQKFCPRCSIPSESRKKPTLTCNPLVRQYIESLITNVSQKHAFRRQQRPHQLCTTHQKMRECRGIITEQKSRVNTKYSRSNTSEDTFAQAITHRCGYPRLR